MLHFMFNKIVNFDDLDPNMYYCGTTNYQKRGATGLKVFNVHYFGETENAKTDNSDQKDWLAIVSFKYDAFRPKYPTSFKAILLEHIFL